MDCIKAATLLNGSLCFHLFLFSISLSNLLYVISEKLPPTSHLVSLPSSGIFEPIEVSPSVLPHYPFLGKTLPPMYPSFPKTYKPVLTGKCPFNFSSITSIMDKTASDCSQLLAPFVANVICCPQFGSSLHIFQGHFTKTSDALVLQNTTLADDCFSDIVEVLGSKGANSFVCSFKSSNLTGGSCPVKDVDTFERTVNTTKLLNACSTIDLLKECCRSVCQPAIVEAAFQISSLGTSDTNTNTNVDVLSDCKGVVYSWLSRKLPSEAADSSFRILAACKVNKEGQFIMMMSDVGNGNDKLNKLCTLNKQSKRERALANWKWEDVINLESSDDESIDLLDSSAPPAKRLKIPRATIKSRHRCYRLIDESDEDDYFFHLHAFEAPAVAIHPLPIYPLSLQDDDADVVDGV